jgi:hypothetical protein
MLIIALVLALIGLVALVFAVVTSNELVAWVCIGASVLGVVLLIVDALRERQRRDGGIDAEAPDEAPEGGPDEGQAVDYPEEAPDASDEDAHEATEKSEDSTVTADRGADEPGQ